MNEALKELEKSEEKKGFKWTNLEQVFEIINKQHNEIERLNKIIEAKNKRIKKLEDNNKDLKAILKEYKYELGLQELENTSIVDLD